MTSAPKWASIFSVWSREASASITVVDAAGVEAGEQHGRLDLRRGDRRAVEDRRRVADALQHDRAAPALRLRQDLRPHQPQRVENPAHRPLAQRGVAVEGRGDPMAADDAHHQPRAGAGVAEIERGARGKQRAESRARGSASGPARGARPTAPSALQASPVRRTSSPSSSPSTMVSPQASRPKMKARWEIDLSPGGRKRPPSAGPRTRAQAGRRGTVARRELTRANSLD